jgi:hypothetical protein
MLLLAMLCLSAWLDACIAFIFCEIGSEKH